MGFFTTFIIAAIFQVAAFLLAPKPKREKPPEADDFKDPTADANRPIPWLFGTKRITGLNTINFADKGITTNSYTP